MDLSQAGRVLAVFMLLFVGAISTVFAAATPDQVTYPFLDLSLSKPKSVATDAGNNLYIADAGNNQANGSNGGIINITAGSALTTGNINTSGGGAGISDVGGSGGTLGTGGTGGGAGAAAGTAGKLGCGGGGGGGGDLVGDQPGAGALGGAGWVSIEMIA